MIQYIARYHSIDLGLAEKAFTAQMLSYSKDGTKPRKAVEREIETYRDTLKIAKTFTPDDLENMSLLKKVQAEQLPKGGEDRHLAPPEIDKVRVTQGNQRNASQRTNCALIASRSDTGESWKCF